MWAGICFGVGVMIGLMIPGIIMLLLALTISWVLDWISTYRNVRRQSRLNSFSRSEILVTLSPPRIAVSGAMTRSKVMKVPVVTYIHSSSPSACRVDAIPFTPHAQSNHH